MKYWSKKISWLALIVMIIITTVGYICPMTVKAASDSKHEATTSMCDSSATTDASTDNGPCASSHLAALSKIVGNVPQEMNLLLALLLTVVYCLIFRTQINSLILPIINRLRHRYLYFQTSIKSLLQEKLIRYQFFIGNSVVSFS